MLYVIRCWRWRILLRKYKRDIPFASLWKATVLGFFISYTLPGRLGEIFRPLYLARREGLRKSEILGTVVLERISDVFFVFMVFLTALFFMSARLENILLRRLFYFVLAFSALIVAFFVILEIVFRRRGEELVRKIFQALFFFLPASLREKAVAFMLKFLQALRPDLERRDLLHYLLLTALFQFCIIPFYWILNLAFDGMGLTLPEIAIYFIFIYIAAAIPTPGMVGSFDFASRLALTEIFGVNPESAIAYTIVTHFLIILFPISAGFYIFWKEGLNWKKLRGVGEKDDLS
jgi:uncharacterized protein (TIRG00374 family)